MGTIVTSGPARAQGTNGPAAILYRLNSETSFQEGCFPPCLCPVMIASPVVGTFLLTPSGFDGLYNNYAVTEVNWIIAMGETNTVVTGSGTYKFGGEFALVQQLSLDLQAGQDSVEHFDSGLVAEMAPFPDIKVTISLHGQVCFDKVFDVSASPAPSEPALRISLATASTVALSWAASPAPFVLEESADLTNWNLVTNRPTLTGQMNQVILSRSSGNKFYRLQPGGN